MASRTRWQLHWQRHERVAHSLRVCADRYRRMTFFKMPRAEFEALREWFEAWHIELQRAYADALNEADNVIGKQWAYDDTMKQVALPARLNVRDDQQIGLPRR